MNRKVLRIIALMICAMMVFVVFSGCNKNEETKQTNGNDTQSDSSSDSNTSDSEDKTGTESEAYGETVTLTLLIDNQAQLDGINAAAEAIKEKYNIATEIELRPSGSEGDNLVKTRLATGDMSDLCFYNSGSLFQALNPEQNFVDLTNEPFMDNVIDSFKVCVSVNGKVFGIPGEATMAGAWLYNKKVYEDLGLSVPKTWQELLDNCEKIKAAGKTAVIGSYKDDWTSQLIVLADYYNVQSEVPTFADDYTANKAKFANTPVALRSFEKLQEIYKKGYMNEDFLATTYDIALKMLAEGTGAHYPILTFALPVIEENFPDKANDIGLFAQPGDSADKNGLTVWMPAGIYLNKNGSNVEAALKWASFFASVDGTNAYASKQKPNGPFAIKGATLPDDVLTAVKDMLPYFEEGNNSPALEFLSPVKGPNLPQICVMAGSGAKAPLECAQEYDKDVEKQAKQLGLAGW